MRTRHPAATVAWTFASESKYTKYYLHIYIFIYAVVCCKYIFVFCISCATILIVFIIVAATPAGIVLLQWQTFYLRICIQAVRRVCSYVRMCAFLCICTYVALLITGWLVFSEI